MQQILRVLVLFFLGAQLVFARGIVDETERHLEFLNEEVSYYCYSELENLVLSSDYSPAEKNRKSSDRVSLDESYKEADVLSIKIIDRCTDYLPNEHFQRPIGTLSYLLKSNTLWAVDSDNRKAQQVKFDKKLGVQYQACIKKEQLCSVRRKQIGGENFNTKSNKWTVVGEGKAFFHSAPTPECRSEINFVIPNDKVKVLSIKATSTTDSDINEYVMASYGRARGWLNIESLTPPEDIYFELADLSKGEYQVKEKRLYFYQSPELACEKPKQPYVIEGDIVYLSNTHTYSGFAYAQFTHPVTGAITSGWLRLNGVSKL